jgi:hypothetical protein
LRQIERQVYASDRGRKLGPNNLESTKLSWESVRDCQEYLNWLCAMMHEVHHSVLLAQWSAEVRHTLTL